MSIKRNATIGGGVILGAMALAGVVASTEINQIRFGGPIQLKNAQVSDLVADILPPPEYVIEPYLEATLLVNDPASLPARKARMAELHKQFDDRFEHWQGSNLGSVANIGDGRAASPRLGIRQHWQNAD